MLRSGCERCWNLHLKTGEKKVYVERLKEKWRNERETEVERVSEKEAYQNDRQTVNMKIEGRRCDRNDE